MRNMIRKALEKDIPTLMDLLHQVNMVHYRGRPDLFRPGTKYTPDELKTILADDARPVFVWCDEEEKVKGYAFCVYQQHVNDQLLTDIRTLYIDDICVDENARHQHIGKQLYEHVADFARKNGFYNITLNVWSLNPGAQAFYESLGMKPYRIGMETILSE